MTAGYVESALVVPSGATIEALNTGGTDTISLTAGSYYLSEYVAHVQSALNAQLPGASGATWSVTLSYTTGLVTFAMSDVEFAIDFTTAAAGTVIGCTGAVGNLAPTGTLASPGLFVPDRPLNLDDDPRAAPMLTDLRSTESPTGFSLGLVGNAKYEHTGLRWAHVSRERYLDTDGGVTPSWERFVKNTQLGQGHSWFRPLSKVKIADQTGALIGSLAGVTKWWFRGVNRVTAKKQSEAWTGSWLIEVPSLVSDGT